MQHALRAFTPKDRKSVKAVADNFRENPKFDAAAAVQELAVGEALISTLDAKGIPSIVDRVLITPPTCRMGPITPAERSVVLNASPLKGAYDQIIDRESAYEKLMAKAEGQETATQASTVQPPTQKSGGWGWGTSKTEEAPEPERKRSSSYPMPQSQREEAQPRAKAAGYQRQTMGEAIAKSAARSVTSSIGSSIGRALVRGVLGSLLKR